MSDSPILRQADARDADLIAAMHADSWARTYRGLLPDGFLDQEVVQDRLVHWQHKIAGPEQGAQAIFIAELDGRPIGFVCVRMIRIHPGACCWTTCTCWRPGREPAPASC